MWKSIQLTLFVMLVCSVALYGQQYNLPEDPAQYTEGVREIMTGANTAEATLTGDNFIGLWDSGKLNEAQKISIITISRIMLKKNYSSREFFVPFYKLMTSAGEQLSPEIRANLLSGLEKAVEAYAPKSYGVILTTLNHYFDQGMLYSSNYNRLYAANATIDFEFIESEENLETLPEATPELPEETGSDNFDDWDTTDPGDGWDTWDTEPAEETQEADPWSSWDAPEQTEQPADNGWGDAWQEESPDASRSAVFGSLTEALTQPEPQPPVEGLVMKLDGVDYTIVTPFDSVTLYNTSGSLMLQKELFVGSGGKFDWSAAGLDPEEVFCTLTDYHIYISKPYFSAEKVKLTYQGKLDEPVEGVFEFESKRRDSPALADFPRFKSYDHTVSVKNLAGDGFIYKGGFALRGQKIIGASVIPGPSQITMQDDSRILFKSKADYISFNDSTVDANMASITIYQQRDSIHHPASRFRYYPESRRLIVRKASGGFKNTPFLASYYNMEIRADMISWDLDTDSLDISIVTARNQIPALFESLEYFSDVRFNRLSGLYNFNPLLMAFSYARKQKSNSFYYLDMAEDLKQNPKLVRESMIDLWQKGYIEFDETLGEVTLKEKAIHYILSNYKRKDYDDLLVPSLTSSAPNGTINLKNQELTVRGIERFFISKSLNVYILPEESSITLLRNRDFKFDGTLFAGNFEFVGRDFTFRYDSFLVDLQQIDSIRFYVEVVDERTNQVRRERIDNKLVAFDSENQTMAGLMMDIGETRGTLYINEPDNKSGLKNFPHYPSFDANRGAVVYFDSKQVLDSAYDHSVFFVIPPFEIDSLSAADPAAIGFEGRFVSGGIFPDFDETLHVMPDNSLGFRHVVPREGYNLYGGSARLYDTLTLNGKGLNASGKIDYLTSTLRSDAFVFYLDSVTTLGSSAVVRAGTLGQASFPDVKLDQYKMTWLPQKDSLYLSNVDLPFQFYNSTATLYGSAIINTNGLYGNGKLFTRGSESVSPQFDFKETEYSARHAQFEIKSDNPKKPALAGNDVRLNFDLVRNEAEINPEVEGVAAIDFPYAQYKTSISKAVWNLEDQKVTMTKPPDIPLESSYFYTTRKELDSLAFNATAAEYDINKLELYITGIPHIKVADAMITPENNEVLILENAKLGQLKNTTIVIDTLNQYHQLVDGTIDIVSRNKFIGNATYQFVNAESDTFEIEFKSFELVEDETARRRDKSQYTVSGGTVSEEESLIISPGMIFRGRAKMYAIHKPLELDGFVKLDFEKIPDYNTWIKYFSSDAERQEVQFDFKSAETERGEPLTAGLHFHNQSNSLYATFVTDRLTPGDTDFFVPEGILSFNQKENRYQIVDTLKTAGQNYSGRIFTYNEEIGEITFEGPLNFMSATEHVSLLSSGIGVGNMYKEEFKVDAFLAFNFDMPSNSLTEMSADIFDVVERLGAPEAHADQANILYKAAEIIGERAAKEYEKRTLEEYMPLWGISKELNRSLVLSTANLKWSADHKAWYSEGKIGVSNILKQDINAFLDGFVEIKKTPEGENVNIFLQVSPVVWYHFSYMNNRLVVSSSNEEFTDMIASKSNVNKAKLGDYVFVSGDIAEALTFVNRFRKTYLGLEEPYQMNVAAQQQLQPDQPQDVLPEEVEERDITNDTEGF